MSDGIEAVNVKIEGLHEDIQDLKKGQKCLEEKVVKVLQHCVKVNGNSDAILDMRTRVRRLEWLVASGAGGLAVGVLAVKLLM